MSLLGVTATPVAADAAVVVPHASSSSSSSSTSSSSGAPASAPPLLPDSLAHALQEGVAALVREQLARAPAARVQDAVRWLAHYIVTGGQRCEVRRKIVVPQSAVVPEDVLPACAAAFVSSASALRCAQLMPRAMRRVVVHVTCTRAPAAGTTGHEDQRLVMYGVREALNVLAQRWTSDGVEDLRVALQGFLPPSATRDERTDALFSVELLRRVAAAAAGADADADADAAASTNATHGSGCGGVLPVRVEMLREGAVFYARTPLAQITAEGEYAPLALLAAELLEQGGLATAIGAATVAQRVRAVMADALQDSSELDATQAAELHVWATGDAGMLAGTGGYSADIVRGCATLTAARCTSSARIAYAAQHARNGGSASSVGCMCFAGSALEWNPEAFDSSLSSGSRIVAVALDEIDDDDDGGVGDVGGAGGRAGAGDAIVDEREGREQCASLLAWCAARRQAVVHAGCSTPATVQFRWQAARSARSPAFAVGLLQAAREAFGGARNAHGFVVLSGVQLLVDGLPSADAVRTLVAAVMSAGFSAESVCVGTSVMVQNVTGRDLGWRVSVAHVEYDDGREVEVMEHPCVRRSELAEEQVSVPGAVTVLVDGSGVPKVHAHSTYSEPHPSSAYAVLWASGPTPETAGALQAAGFESLRATIRDRWDKLMPRRDPISDALAEKIAARLGGGAR